MLVLGKWKSQKNAYGGANNCHYDETMYIAEFQASGREFWDSPHRNTPEEEKIDYDVVSSNFMIPVPKLDESEGGVMVLEKSEMSIFWCI